MSQDTADSDSHAGRVQLGAAELTLWHALKKISATTTSLMKAEIAPGVSGADYSILSRLEELGGPSQSLKQSQLLSSLGWDKSRLSHQITRMEERGFVMRVRTGKEAEISLLALGASVLVSARPNHALVIREYLSKFTGDERQILLSIAGKI